MSKHTVILETVYRWKCPHCGKVTIEEGVPIDDPETLADVEAAFEELEGGREGEDWKPKPEKTGEFTDFITLPMQVTCIMCMGVFDTVGDT